MTGDARPQVGEPELRELLLVTREATAHDGFLARMAAVAAPLARLAPSSSVSLLLFRRGPDGGRALVSGHLHGAEPAAGEEYARYIPHDPMVDATGLSTLEDWIPGRRFGGDPFTGEFLPRHGLRYLLGIRQPLLDDHELFLCLHRARTRRGDYGRRERRLIGLAAPEVLRAAFGAVLRDKLDGLARRGARPGVVGPGHLVLDARGDVRSADAAALEVVRSLGAGFPVDALVLAGRRVATAAAPEPLARTFRRSGRVLRLRVFPLEGRPMAGAVAVVELLPVREPGPGAAARLTPREREVARLAAAGASHARIAARLSISLSTVKLHLARCYTKLGVRGKVELARLAATELAP